ncbi:MAG: long-chain fatty acid--CoA ligase [Firmicutes bacterium]|nr:long-chain fatty acid--CoA ligase [Bacillota bacterium]
MACANVVDIMRESALRWPDRPAQRYWTGSHWQDRSYRELWEAIQSVARGLKTLGIQPGDRVGLLARTRPEWVIADYAILCADAVTVPIYPTSSVDDVAHIATDAQIGWAVVENDQLAEKLPENVGRIFIETSKGEHPLTLDTLSTPGDALLPMRSGGDVATLVYTSGTTGRPKGVMLTHQNLLTNVEDIVSITNTTPQMTLTAADVCLSLLPLSHILERTCHNVFLDRGVTIAYARSPQQLAADLKSIRPTLMVVVPRVLEKIYERINAEVATASGFKRRLFQHTLVLGEQRYQRLIEAKSAPTCRLREEAWLDRAVSHRIREAVGGRLRLVISGGAPLSADIGRFFFALGIPVLEGYGLTETAPVLTVNRLPVPRFGSVGQPLPQVSIRIADDGEILARGPNISPGYWNQPEKTAAAFSDGWFHTGDVGWVTHDGYLVVADRKKLLIVLSTGKNVAPQRVEQKLMLSPAIDQAVVVGNNRKYVAALIYVSPTWVNEWGRKRGLDPLSYQEAIGREDLLAEVFREVQRTTRDLAPFERPKTVRLLPQPLAEETGELTPSLKVKMAVVEQKYGALIEDMYTAEHDQPLETLRGS